LALLIEPRNERRRILLGGPFRIDRSHQGGQLRALSLVAEVEVRGVLEHRCLGNPVERVRHQHGVALSGEALRNLAHRRPQAKRIRPDHDSRMGPAGRVDESCVARTIRSLDFDVHFHHLLGSQVCSGGRGNSRRDGHRHEVSTREVVLFHVQTPLTGK
jgi:hypothetical protein